MDISNISKIGSRKRINIEAEKLREKVSRETTKVIKLRVAQDTAYWDLKEKLHQVESNHERLQQNMVEVQMQHESISGQYQEELRLRPETLNKLNSTREICEVLESYTERLRETVGRCAADQAALCDAYNNSAKAVGEMRQQQVRAAEKTAQMVEHLQEKLKLSSEHHSQLVQFLSTSKQQADAELAQLRAALQDAAAKRDELVHTVNELNRKLDVNGMELQKKEESIKALQGDIKHIVQEFTLQSNEMKNSILKQDKELKEASDSNEALKKALTNQEAFSKSVCDQNNQLLEKVAALEEDHSAAKKVLQDLEQTLQKAHEEINKLETLIAHVNDSKGKLEEAITEKDMINERLEKDIDELKARLENIEVEKSLIETELRNAVEDSNCKAAKNEELVADGRRLEEKCEHLETTIKTQQETMEAKMQELTTVIQEKEKDLNCTVETVNSLMSDVKNMTDMRTILEGNLQKMKKDMENERESAAEREGKFKKQIENLESAVREKDNEISKQLSIILEMRNEKKRLQEKIANMQGTIDNIQKELTGRGTNKTSRLPADHDDNAVMLTPARKIPRPESPVLKPGMCQKEFPRLLSQTQQAELPPPRSHQPKQLDPRMFNFLSDGSMEGGDTVDEGEVNRRIEALARGERVGPMPFSSLKRRAGVPACQGGLRCKAVVNEEETKERENTFFKNKKTKKSKQP